MCCVFARFCKGRQQPRGYSADVQHMSAGAFGDFESMSNASQLLDLCSFDEDLDEKAELRRGGALIFEDLMMEAEFEGDGYRPHPYFQC